MMTKRIAVPLLTIGLLLLSASLSSAQTPDNSKILEFDYTGAHQRG